MESEHTGVASPSASEYLAAWAHLALAATGVDIAGRFSDQFNGQGFARPLAWALATVALVGVAWASRAPETERRRPLRRALGAVAIGFAAALAPLGPLAALAAATVAGLAAGPDLALIVFAHRARRQAGQATVFPEGFPRGRLILLFVSPLVVVAAIPVLSGPRAGLLAGIAAGLWAVGSTERHPNPLPMERLRMASAALPPLMLGIGLLGLGPLLIGMVTTPVLLWRVRRFAGLAAATTLLLAASLSQATADQGRAPSARGFEKLRVERIGGPATLAAMAVLHRDTGAYQVRYAGMELYTDQNDARFSEGLVHPVMAMAPRRNRILLVGVECSGILGELAKYPRIERLDLVTLHPGIDAFCRSVPAIGERLGPRPDLPIREFRFVALEQLVRTTRREGRGYDVILVHGPHPPLSPVGLHSGDFYTLLRGLTAPDGLLAARLGGFSSPALAYCALTRVREHYQEVIPYYLLGAGGPTPDHHLYVVAARKLPRVELRFRVPTRVVSEAIFRGLMNFPKGVAFSEVPEPPGGCTVLGRRR